jgi:predicted outer membrane repeat protein
MFIENGNPVLSEMIFDGNVASNFGGGMYNSNAYTDLSNVTFRGNAGHSGGGMYNWQSNPELDSVTFSGNSADLNGGGMFNDSSYPMVMNVTFQGNAAASYGGGMFQKSGNPSLIQVTFSGNSAALAGGAIANDAGSPLISNSILYDNTGGEIHNFGLGSSPYVTHSIVKGGYPGINVLDADPHLGPLAYNGGFTQTMALLSGSYAIDAGDDENCTDSDQRGVHRPQDEHCDMGAYEAKGSIRSALVE